MAASTPAMRWRVDALARTLVACARDLGVASVVDVQALDQVDSTNTWLLERLRDRGATRPSTAAPPLHLVVTDRQTAGRGRQGRAWHATPGGSLAFSIAATLGGEVSPSLALRVGAAIADAVDPPAAEPPRVRLKWPNDLWLNDAAQPRWGGRKLGGILIETVPTARGRAVVVGCGINLDRPADAALAASSSLPDYALAGWREAVPCAEAVDVLHRAAPAIAQVLLTAGQRPEGGVSWLDAWRRRDLLHGRRVQSMAGGRVLVTGTAEGPRADGALVVRGDDGQITAVTSGEITVRPIAAEDPPPLP